MFEVIWASLISLLVSSTPTISSPWTEDFPILDLKKPPSLFLISDIDLPPDSLIESFFPNSGFFNFILFNLSNKLVVTFDFWSSFWLFWLVVEIFSKLLFKFSLFWFCKAVVSILGEIVSLTCSDCMFSIFVLSLLSVWSLLFCSFSFCAVSYTHLTLPTIFRV